MRFTELFENEVTDTIVDYITDKIVDTASTGDLIHSYFRMSQGHDPYHDDTLDNASEEFRSFVNGWVHDRVYDVEYSIRSLFKGDHIQVYRVITAPEDWHPGDRHPGIYWSWDKDAAEAHWGNFDGNHVLWMLETILHKDDIDWPRTYLMNVDLQSETEKEITVRVGIGVEVTNYYRVD
jgi:hypothetical protein